MSVDVETAGSVPAIYHRDTHAYAALSLLATTLATGGLSATLVRIEDVPPVSVEVDHRLGTSVEDLEVEAAAGEVSLYLDMEQR